MSLWTSVLSALRSVARESALREYRKKLTPKPVNDRFIQARLPGVCYGCNEDFPENTHIVWNTLTKSTYHRGCNPNNPKKARING